MSEPKFTPGPWYVGTPPPNGEQTIGTVTGLMVAVATTGHNMAEETKANAHLIAAAPELYDACEAVIRYQKLAESDANTGLLMSYAEAYIKAEAALAKARGE